jgi:DNA-binding transcriptional MerR regulator/methylmalonyl-CoA mutase cobalamin-binding subunit
MYTIKQAAARSGLSVPVVRAWERRYGVVRPTRTPSGYRLYDDAAVDRLRTMQALIARGWSPSTAAAALVAGTAPAVELEAEGDAEERTATASRDQSLAVDRSADLRSAFVEAARVLDANALEHILDEMFATGSFEVVVERHILPALVELGDAWAAGRVGVGGEHAASHAVARRLAGAYQAAASSPHPDGAVLVGLPPGARHELGALAFAVTARRAGLPVLYLGADLPIDDWVATARRMDASAAVIAAVERADGERALGVARALADERPGIVIGLGGRMAPDPGPSGPWPQPAPIVLPDGMADAVEAVRAAIGRRAS